MTAELPRNDPGLGAPYAGRMGSDYLDYYGVAERMGISVATVRRYLGEARANRRNGVVKPSDMPEPDETFGQSPAWKPATIDRWLRKRPGKGVGGALARELRKAGVEPEAAAHAAALARGKGKRRGV